MKKIARSFPRVLALLLLIGMMLPAAPAFSQGSVREYNVSAIDVVITLNRFGDHDPTGKMFVLDENIPAVRAQEARPLPGRVSTGLRDDPIQPLVIRANIGDTVVINFTNRLGNGRASLHINGLAADRSSSAGANLGLNPDSTVAPGESITYTWHIPDERNAEGAYVFSSMGDDMRQQMAHGLFGVLNVEPKGATWLNPVDGQPLKSGWEAIIVDPNGKDFREDTIIYHEIGDESFRVSEESGSPLPLNDPLNEDAYRPASRAINYRSEPFFNRQELVEPILGHPDGSQNYGSYMFGDVPTPTPRGYLGDPTKRRIVHAGSERFHVEHLHGGSIRWQFDPFAAGSPDLPGGVDFFGLAPTKDPPDQTRSQRLDSQAIGPLETYTIQPEGGAGGLQNVPGDFLFHCHFAHHYVAGMWAYWRAFDTLQTGAPWQVDPLHPLAELPDRAGLTPAAVDSTQLIGSVMPSGRTLTDAPTSSTNLNIDDWIRTKIPPQGDPGPESDYDASVWDWKRVDNIDELDQLAQQDPTMPTIALLRSLGFNPLPGQPLYLGEPETTRVWPNYQAPPGAAGKRLPIMFNPANARPAYSLLRPHLGRRPPFPPMRSGSPYSGDPDEGFAEENPNSLIPKEARRLEYVKVTIPLELTLNEDLDIRNSEGALPVLDEDKEDILAGRKPAEQLTIRANVGDGIDVIHYTEIPIETFDFFKSNLHYHFVQFENQASDGVISGLAYEQSVAPYTFENIHLAADAPAGSTTITVDDAARLKVNAFIGIGFGVARRNRDGDNLPVTLNRNGGFEWAQITGKQGNTLTLDRPLENDHTAGQFVGLEFVRQQFYADAESGTTFFHNHVFAVPGFGMPLTGAIIQEPRGSTWHDPVTGAPIRSGTVADIRNVSVPVAPGIPVQDFREFVTHQMDAVTGVGERKGGERAGYNAKMEPLDEGDRAEQPHLAFSSVRNGDPETPVFRTYAGNLGVIRLMESSGHDIGAFHIEGHRFRQTRFDPNEAPKDTLGVGISERFDLFFTAGSVGLQSGDYVFMNAMHEKMLDAWGIIRVLDTLQADLQPLPNSPRQSIRPPDDTTFPQNQPGAGDPPPAPQVSSVAELKTRLERNGYSLMNGLPVDQIPVRTYDVAAIETEISLTPGFQKNNGRIYVLAEDEAAVRNGTKPPEPLVIRANIGEIVKINFTNKLPGTRRASFAVPQLIKSADDLGSAFGLNNDSTVSPGETRTYWYVIDPRFEVPRSFVISDYGDPFEGGQNGLYGLFIVEPEGTTYHDPATGNEVKAGWNVEVRMPDGGKFRDVALLLHDEDPRMNRDIMPYDKTIDGDRGINYRAESFNRRDDAFPASVLSTLAHGDPRTPLIEVGVGEQVRFHVGFGFGEQPHVMTLDGHRFPIERVAAAEAMHLYARQIVPRSTIDAAPEDGAGGPLGLPGDYLYRDSRNSFFEGGLWGIFRVKPRAEAPALQGDIMGNLVSVPIEPGSGATLREFTVTSPDGIGAISLPAGTRLLSPEGKPVNAIGVHWNLNPPPAPPGTMILAALDPRPEGTRILPAVAVQVKYSLLKLPAGVSERDLFIAELEHGAWQEVSAVVDTAAGTITATTDSLEMYALMAKIPNMAPPTSVLAQTQRAAAGVDWRLASGLVIAAVVMLAVLFYTIRRQRARHRVTGRE
ncbi:MAG: multicopper oxidase domain-containing protein [Chloroflexi bacterium]|nr:multicopper oxidase domain-containing protein [Chloroflexota bacterium]